MESQRRMYLIIAIIIMPFFSNSFTSSATSPHPLSKTATDVCNKRGSTQDQLFCHQVFGSDPRSSSADNVKSLTQICVDNAIKDMTNTHALLVKLSQNKAINAVLKPVVDACMSSFVDVPQGFKSAVSDFPSDPCLSYDDLKFELNDLRPCETALKQTKIPQPEILSGYQTAIKYVSLCKDVTNYECETYFDGV